MFCELTKYHIIILGPQIVVRLSLSSNNLEEVIYTHGAQANSAFHPSGVGKSSTGLSGWG